MSKSFPSIRIGLLGAGGVVLRRHLPALQAHPETFKVRAVTRGNYNLLAEAKTATGAESSHKNWQDLVCSPDIDAVLIASPNAFHAEQAIAAMKAGKDVFCEKPPARTYKEALEMERIAEQTGRILQYGFLMRFGNDTQIARKAVTEGELGEVYHIRNWWFRRRGYPTKGSWFTTKALSGGGPLMDIGSHLLDRALYILGYPKIRAVSALTHARLGYTKVEQQQNTGVKSGASGICDVEDLASCLFRLENGASLTLETSFAVNRAEAPVASEFLGDRAGLRIELGKHPIRYGEAGHELTENIIVPAEADSADALYQRQWSHFANCVRSRTQPGPNAQQGSLLMQALTAAYRSAECGREWSIEDSE